MKKSTIKTVPQYFASLKYSHVQFIHSFAPYNNLRKKQGKHNHLHTTDEKNIYWRKYDVLK